MVPMNWYLALSAAVFSIGVMGFLIRKNIIIMFMSLELMLNGVNIGLITLSHYMQDLSGQIMTFFIITVAASEAAVGLAIIISLFRNKETTHIDDIREMRG